MAFRGDAPHLAYIARWTTMNKQWVSCHLREACDELQRTIAEIESVEDYSEGEFQVAITHVYHHLNTAWNSRNVNDQEFGEVPSEEDFLRHRRFPADIDMGG